MRFIVIGVVGIVLAVPATAFAGGGGGCNQTLSEGEPLVVSMTQSCYGPEVATIEAGQALTFTNADPYPHTVTAAGQQWGSTELVSHGESIEVVFDEPGVYAYMCILHAGMAGAVVVSEAATAAVDPVALSDDTTGSAEMPSVTAPSATPVLIYAAIAAVGLAAMSVHLYRSRFSG